MADRSAALSTVTSVFLKGKVFQLQIEMFVPAVCFALSEK